MFAVMALMASTAMIAPPPDSLAVAPEPTHPTVIDAMADALTNGDDAEPPESLEPPESPESLEVPESLEPPEVPEFPATPEAPEPSIQDIFEEVFGTPQPTRIQPLRVPFILDGQSRGQVLVIVPGGTQTEVLVATDGLLAALQGRVRETVLEQLAEFSQPDGTLTAEAIREVGLAFNFDSRRVELQMEIPAALRSITVQELGRFGEPPELAQAIRPRGVSGYVNLRGSQEVVWSGLGSRTGRQPLRLNWDGALNVEGWVLEGNWNFSEGSDRPWQRGAIRMVYDDLNTAIRYQAGEIPVPVRGYQASLPLLGVSMARNFSIQPFQITRPVSRFEFFLERPSTVEVFINGQSVQTLRLEPGPQDIRNLPLNAGINGVQLVITDDLGRVEQLDFATGVSGDLLAPGVQQFAYSVGFPAPRDPFTAGDQEYDWSQPTLALAHRFGLTDTLTLGGYGQSNLTTHLVGVEGTWASRIGNLGWDAALSLDADQGLDLAARLFYDWLFSGGGSRDARSLRVSTEYRGANFITLADALPSNRTALDLSVAYNQTIFDNTRMTLSGRYQFTRDQPSDAYTLALRLSQPVGRGTTLNVTTSYGQTAQGTTEPRIFVGMSSSFAPQRQFVNASTTLGNEGSSQRLNWSYSAPVTFGGLSTALTATTSDSRTDLSSQTRYRGYRTELSLDHRITLSPTGNRETAQSTRLTWGTALVFANGQWGWSRPVSNSFVIVARQGTAQGTLVQVNPSPNGAQALANHFGAAVVPLSPYSLTTIFMDAPDLPLGEDLGQARYRVFPTYRSGIVLRVGSEATVILRGTLLDQQGNPVELSHGRILSRTDPDWPAVEIVTNRAGRFVAPGLKPGQYDIWIFGFPEPVAPIDIPSGATGVYTLDAIPTQIPAPAP